MLIQRFDEADLPDFGDLLAGERELPRLVIDIDATLVACHSELDTAGSGVVDVVDVARSRRGRGLRPQS